MKKKLLMRLAAAALAAGMCLSNAGAAFTDVSPDAWYYDAVTKCENYGLMNGYEDGSFRPTASVNRAQCAVILNRMAGDNYNWWNEGYQDNPSTEWYHDAVLQIGGAMGGSKMQFVYGSQYPRTWFYPKQACKRENFAMGLYQVLGLYFYKWQYNFNDLNKFSPAEYEDFDYTQAGSALATLGIMVGDTHGNFNPQKSITRAEMAQTLCNLLEVAENE